MNDLILHQYAASPFSEKVRCLLGYKRQAYRSVEIPVIMPKPDLMALTGGYRKTPVLQIGADIYCDTSLICRLIDRLFPDKPVYLDEQMATVGAAAHWTDTFLFRMSVAVAFQPRALAGSDLFSDEAAAEAFMADRADFSKGSTALGLDLATAEPHWLLHMRRLDNQLSVAAFLGGDAPNILDFSTYHCCWFVYKNEVLKSGLDTFPALAKWIQAMAAFGQGEGTAMTGEEAVDIAKASEIATESKLTPMSGEQLSLGGWVEVMPIDYGFQPTRGELLVASMEELVVRRQDERAGQVAVHFPRLGFQIKKHIIGAMEIQ
jgi:glutathione S-transferase